MSINQFVVFNINLIGDGSSTNAKVGMRGYIKNNGVFPIIPNAIVSVSGSVGGISVASATLDNDTVTVIFTSAPFNGATGSLTIILSF